MGLSCFDDKANQPSDADVAAELETATDAWDALRSGVVAALGDVRFEWGFTAKSAGWGQRARAGSGGRVILYLTPRRGSFLASFVLGENAAAAARAARLPDALLAAIEAAPRYAEGRGVRLEVRDVADVPGLVRLAEIKAAS